jgi:hypothetical protein
MATSLLSETNPGDALFPFPLPVLSQEGWDGAELAPATYMHPSVSTRNCLRQLGHQAF